MLYFFDQNIHREYLTSCTVPCLGHVSFKLLPLLIDFCLKKKTLSNFLHKKKSRNKKVKINHL